MVISFRGKYSDSLMEKVRELSDLVGKRKAVYVSIDTRPSSPLLKHQIITSLLSHGTDVYDLGIGPTPYLSYFTKFYHSLGIMVTASHNPESDNGIKVFYDGLEVDQLADYGNKQNTSKGTLYDVSYLKHDYIDSILNQLNTNLIKDKKPTIVIDCGNGTAGNFTPYLLTRAGARVITINAEHSNPFSRDSEPTPQSLSYLARLVNEYGADFGIAHDPDADRCRIVTRTGMMSQDMQLLNIALYMCHPGDTFVTTVEASQVVIDELLKRGIKTEVTPVGSGFVGKKIKESGAVFGGEPCGEYIFPTHIYSADGILTALKFVEMFCERGFLSFDEYYVIRGQIDVGTKNKDKVLTLVSNKLSTMGVNNINRMDGLLFKYADAKVLIRKSNTQDVIRITVEHMKENVTNEVYENIHSIVEGCIK